MSYWSDIIREYDGIANIPGNFDKLFTIHQGFEWEDNLLRLVEATSNITPTNQKFNPTEEQRANIYRSIERARDFVASQYYQVLNDDLNDRCFKCRNEILIASHIENTNIRGRLIESLITSSDEERVKIIGNLKDIESALPSYDTKNGLGDYYVKFENSDTYTDIKTKIIYLNSNSKAYNIDKFLKQMADSRSVFLFFFIGVDENDIFKTLLCSVYHNKLIENTILQFHWAGRSTRGAAQFNGTAIDEMLQEKDFQNIIKEEQARLFLKRLLEK